MPAKTKRELKTKCGNSCCSKEQTTSVFILNSEDDTQEFEMLKLKHPHTEKQAYFVFSKNKKNIYELFTFSDPYRSYFIDTTVKCDGNLYITTPIDPLFLCLPYLLSSIHCSPLDQILRDDGNPGLERLLECPSLEKNITKIADKRGVTVFGYKYNEDKTLKWLERKVDRTANALMQHSIQVSCATTVISNNYIKNSSDSVANKDQYLKCAFGIVCEYLNSELKQKLQEHLKISFESDQTVGKRDRSASQESSQDIKKLKISTTTESNETDSPPKHHSNLKVKPPTVSAKEKARVKAAAGSKSISSFFKKST